MINNKVAEKKDDTVVVKTHTNNFEFLPDDPVSEDSFGCHKRISDSIAEKIETDPRGKTVGLEGTWGSGKSSIIKMLEERWEEREDVKVFTYDAWAHQGDPLRRAFLEELIKSLQSPNWLVKCVRENHNFEDYLRLFKKQMQWILPITKLFGKQIGKILMKKSPYYRKIKKITSIPQFEQEKI